MPAGANAEAIEAAAETAERLGWRSAWTTDHLIVPHATAGAYGEVFELLITLAHIGARHPRLRLGTSVIVVPMRNALIVGKELATLDLLSRGRVIAGIGVGWNETEFNTVGAGDVFHSRGAYLDETIRLWRHLWSGATDAVPRPILLVRRFHVRALAAAGRRAADHRRRRLAGRAATGRSARRRLPRQLDLARRLRRLASRSFARQQPRRAARPLRSRAGCIVRFDGAQGSGYAMTGSPDEMVAEVRAFAAAGRDGARVRVRRDRRGAHRGRHGTLRPGRARRVALTRLAAPETPTPKSRAQSRPRNSSGTLSP